MDGLSCEVVAYELHDNSVDELIREEAKLASARGMSLEWKAFSFDLPTDLPGRLRSAGYSVGEQEAVVVYDLTHGLEDLFEADTANVKRVTGEFSYPIIEG